MPSSRESLILLSSIFIAAVHVVWTFVFGQDNINNVSARHYRSQSIGVRPARDVHSDLYGTPFFKHYTGVDENIFDFISFRLLYRLDEPRNIDFAFTRAQNMCRRRRPCKLDHNNRLMHFLHTVRTGQIVWDSALEYEWNIYSVSMDLFHCLYHFVDELYDEIVHPMNAAAQHSLTGCLQWSV